MQPPTSLRALSLLLALSAVSASLNAPQCWSKYGKASPFFEVSDTDIPLNASCSRPSIFLSPTPQPAPTLRSFRDVARSSLNPSSGSTFPSPPPVSPRFYPRHTMPLCFTSYCMQLTRRLRFLHHLCALFNRHRYKGGIFNRHCCKRTVHELCVCCQRTHIGIHDLPRLRQLLLGREGPMRPSRL